MSVFALTAVWQHSHAKGSSLLLMLALADYADENNEAWPSVAKLARKSRMSERNAQYGLRKLVDDGELEVVEPGGRRNGKALATRYRLTMRVGAKSAPKEDGCKPASEMGANGRTSRVQPVAPQPSKEPSVEPSSPPTEDLRVGQIELLADDVSTRPKTLTFKGKRISAEEWTYVEAIIPAFNTAYGTSYDVHDPHAAKKIVGTLRQYPDARERTPEQHLQVLANCSTNPWWDGEGKPGIQVIYSPGGWPASRARDAQPTGRAAKKREDKQVMAAINKLANATDEEVEALQANGHALARNGNDPLNGYF